MPVTYTNSLAPRAFPAFRKSFKWLDDPAEDADFVAWVRETVDQNASPSPNQRIRELTVDRSSTPVIRWEVWDFTWVDDEQVWSQVGTDQRVIGPAGTFWRQETINSSSLAYLGPLTLPGYWECDQYGRALSVDSLVVL